jgi:D-3-phosphoglycerate dehydrogenase
VSGTVLITSRSFSTGTRDLVADLAGAGLAVVRGPVDHRMPAIADPLRDAVAWIAGTGPVTGAHLAAAPRLRVLARYGVGVDSVDLRAAREHGIVVTNTPGANSAAVADHTLALLLALLRGVPVGDRRVRHGDWRVFRGRELGALTVGLIGLGRIGREVAARLRGFGSTVLASDPYVAEHDMACEGVRPALLAELAQRCDAVSLHAPGGSVIATEDWLRHTNPGLFLVNTARADLIDEQAVAQAIRSGRLAGYAADTLSTESGAADGSPLLDADLTDRVVLTPHVGAATVEAIDRMGAAAVANVVAVLSGREPGNPVGRP